MSVENPDPKRPYSEDDDYWERLAALKKERMQRKRNAMHNTIERNKLSDRVEYPNEGTCLVDGKFYYYCQKKKARVKGSTKYYQMRGLQHFIDTFLK